MTVAINQLGFDFDGVIADTAEAFVRLACLEYGYCGFHPGDITSFSPADCLNIPEAVVEQIFTDILTDSIAAGLRPMPGAVSALTRMSAAAPVTIITARSLSQPVCDWLDLLIAQENRGNIRVIATGDHDDKLRYIHAHRLKFFIDDRLETCRLLALEKIIPYLFSQPWNRHHQHSLRTVNGWDDIMALVDSSEV
ncbi:MAG TPA: hypothetical protein VK857_09485 [Desulforhopalus sp.]|nr:hypothetical protein [Desulforhopalus sp.]